MDNETKQYLATLEARIMKLERVLEAVTDGMHMVSVSFAPTCNQCGACDPTNTGHICGQVDCCQGLNPEDDKNPSP